MKFVPSTKNNMARQGVFMSFWICFLLFNIGTCFPVRKDYPTQQGGGGGSGSGGSGSGGSGSGGSGSGGGGSSGTGSGVGSGSAGSSAAQDAGLSQMIADLMRLSPSGGRPVLQSHWSSSQVPKGMVETRPVFPSSLIIFTDSGYQRARDFRTDSKYTQDIFDSIPQPENPGSGSKGHQKT